MVELAQQITAINAMVDSKQGITLNVAPIWGGTRPNVIAPEAGCEIDLRVQHRRGRRAAWSRRCSASTAVTSGCKVSVDGRHEPAALHRDAGRSSTSTTAPARSPPGSGFEMPKQHRGGGSDGNFTAALGVPTLDGLGCPGSRRPCQPRAHPVAHLAPRAALMAGLLEALD